MRSWLKQRDIQCASDAMACRSLYYLRIAALAGLSIKEVASPLTLHTHHAAVMLNDGRVLIAGGIPTLEAYGDAQNSVEIYDPKKDSWHQVANLSVPRTDGSAVLLKDGRVFLLGGAESAEKPSKIVEIYDPKTNSWSKAAPLPDGYDFNNYLAPEYPILLDDGRVLVKQAIYDPAKDKWSTRSDAPNLDRAAESPLPAGQILFAGGRGPVSDVSILNPTNDTWRDGKGLNEARGDARALLLESGKVLVVGGRCSYQSRGDCSVDAVETYDASKDQWTKTGSFLPKLCETEFLFEIQPDDILSITWCGGIDLYNVQSGNGVPIGDLGIKRDFTATRLLDRSILIVSQDKTLLISVGGSPWK